MNLQSPYILDSSPVSYAIGSGALEYSERIISTFPRIILLVDENVARLCLPVFKERLPSVSISGIVTILAGEEKKNLEASRYIWNELTKLKVDRDALIVNLGGGVVSDIGGFTAATFKRGVKFINYPTTLLGMIDAAIGGKTGIDFGKYKNQVGLFVDPISVVIDPIFLKTLDNRQLQSGFAELLKYALITDLDLWEMLKGVKFTDITEWNTFIVKAARDKIDIVKHDTHEKGIRKNLNFGHTVGHSFESYFLMSENPVTHGMAIAAGMICEAYISVKMNDIGCEVLNEIVAMIDLNFERLQFTPEQIPALFEIMMQDKKVRNGKLQFSLLKKLGKTIHNCEVADDLLKESLHFYIEKGNCIDA